jgi:hypothetical protein
MAAGGSPAALAILHNPTASFGQQQNYKKYKQKNY